ncbi:MAG TPA: sodium:solute symporter [Gemmatimonadales bacterium]|nr:sodium:solute symporter [Gemmatimonadales bacterium]
MSRAFSFLMRSLDLVVIVVYFVAVVATGLLLAGRQQDAADYFLGRRGLPWWAIMLSIVATETSALTVISVPGIAARGNLTFLQLAFGYLLGRIGVASLLLPGYFDGTQETAYQRLERRFGVATRRIASGAFLVTRALGDGVRVYATAIPLAIITQWSIPAGIFAVGIVTIFYTWVGGLRAVVWVDVIQLVFYLLGAIATILIALHAPVHTFAEAWSAGKLTVIDPALSFTRTYTLWGGLIGGALLSAASHGTDHLIVQRLLASRDLADSKRALIGSGVFIIAQFALFLFVGTALWMAGADRPDLAADAIYPTFVVERLPAGIAGLVVAAILAAAMSTVSSSLNSLASASTHDFYAPLTGRTDSEHLLKVGRGMTLLWAAILVGGALLFKNRNTPVVVLALSIASITYGGLLGSYLLGGLWRRTRQVDVVIAILVGVAFMIPVVLGFPTRILSGLAWPWYVPLGTAVTVLVGMVSSLFGRPDGQTAGRPQASA